MTIARTSWSIIAAVAASLALPVAAQDRPGFRDTPMLPGGTWRVHDADRPAPVKVAPSARPGGAPDDAIVLFDGRSLDGWHGERGLWPVADGAFSVPSRAASGSENNLVTKASFGDVQLHLEFRSPNPPTKTSQDRGNSGIWFMQRYEVQILDGYDNPTYADGTVGAVYGWKPPLANAARPPGIWQNYDIVFERPRFDEAGKLLKPAYVTAFLNGVLVQNHQAMLGTTVWRRVAQYDAHADAAPLQLQDHGSPVSFRNIWVRPLPEAATTHELEKDGK